MPWSFGVLVPPPSGYGAARAAVGAIARKAIPVAAATRPARWVRRSLLTMTSTNAPVDSPRLGFVTRTPPRRCAVLSTECTGRPRRVQPAKYPKTGELDRPIASFPQVSGPDASPAEFARRGVGPLAAACGVADRGVPRRWARPRGARSPPARGTGPWR